MVEFLDRSVGGQESMHPAARPILSTPSVPAVDLTVTRIGSGPQPLVQRLPELWHYRELLYFLAARDILVRYRQTLLGVAWAILQPLAAMILFSLFFAD